MNQKHRAKSNITDKVGRLKIKPKMGPKKKELLVMAAT